MATSTTLSLSIGATRAGFAELQGPEVAEPRRTGRDSGKNQEHVGTSGDTRKRLPLPCADENAGDYQEDHERTDERGEVRPTFSTPTLAKMAVSAANPADTIAQNCQDSTIGLMSASLFNHVDQQKSPASKPGFFIQV